MVRDKAGRFTTPERVAGEHASQYHEMIGAGYSKADARRIMVGRILERVRSSQFARRVGR